MNISCIRDVRFARFDIRTFNAKYLLNNFRTIKENFKYFHNRNFHIARLFSTIFKLLWHGLYHQILASPQYSNDIVLIFLIIKRPTNHSNFHGMDDITVQST